MSRPEWLREITLEEWRQWGESLPGPVVVSQAMADDPRLREVLAVVPHLVSTTLGE